MRKCAIAFGLFIVLFYIPASAQWTRVADFGGPATDGCVSFVIDGMAYVGGGPGVTAFYRYDPETDSWMKRADIGGGPRGWAFAFTVNGKGYVGGGDPTGSFQPVNDFWEYDPATDAWTQLGDFPGGNRDAAMSFAIGDVGFVGAGFDGGNSYNDFWSYYPPSDSWTNLGNYPGGAVLFPVSFVINGKAYVGTGTALPEVDTFYEYNPQKNQWRQLPDFPGGPRQAAVGFAANGKGYLGGGLNGPYGSATQYNDFYEYDPITETWTKWDDGMFPITNLSWASAFVINDVAYLGTGAKVPEFQYTRHFYRYIFGGALEHSLGSGGSMNMGQVLVGETRDTLITFTNTGKASLEVTDVSLSGSGTDAFIIQVPALPSVLNPGDDLDVGIRFSPAKSGVFTANISAVSDASVGSQLAIPVSGEGTSLEPSLALTPTQLLFGSVTVGESKDSTIELRNTGQATLHVTGVVIENDGEGYFSLPGLSVPFDIAPSSAVEIAVRFSPGAAGNFNPRFSVLSDASNGEQHANIVGVGRAPSREISLSVDKIDFGTVYLVGEKDTLLRIENNGADPLVITDAIITGASAAVFGFPAMQFPFIIDPDEYLDIALLYTPGLDENTHNAVMTVYSNATNGSEQTVTLTGTCTVFPEARVEFDRTAIDFGDVVIDTYNEVQLKIENTGTLDVIIDAITIIGDIPGVFSTTGFSVPFTIPRSQSKTITLRFEPDATGDFPATLSFSTDVPGSEKVNIPMTGTGIPLTGIWDGLPVAPNELHVYPNPVRAGGTIVVASEKETVSGLALYSSAGKCVQEYGMVDLHGAGRTLIVPSNLATGTYFVVFRGAHLSRTIAVKILSKQP